MASYNKKVIYLSYMEEGTRIKSAGFVKMENREGNVKLDMGISGLLTLLDGTYEVYAYTQTKGEHVLGKIYMHQGMGTWSANYYGGKVAGESINYEDITEIKIKLSDNKTIEGRLHGISESKKENKKQGLQEKPEDKQKDQEEKPQNNKNIYAKEPELKAGSLPEYISGTEECGRGGTEERIKMEQVILNDKWQQLMQVYPVVHPYEDDRKYVSIEPKDFVIMTGDYQHLANNSFLLHGFYNYRHIVLGKEADSNIPNGSFYLGVPGVYYEREKMVALMFGFEAFECNGGRAEPGKFGYYLRKVKI